MRRNLPPKLVKLSAAKQRVLDELLDKNSEGTITSVEKVRLERLVAEAEQLMVANAKRLANFADSETEAPPVGAMPVTVWVQPAQARR